MKFSSSLVFLAFVAGAFASPIAARAAPASVTCDTTVYSDSDINNAIMDGHSRAVRKRGYPHQYFGRDKNVTLHCTGSDFIEYPILDSKQVYGGSGKPGPDRVVYTPTGDYCGVITHIGAPVGKFQSCAGG